MATPPQTTVTRSVYIIHVYNVVVVVVVFLCQCALSDVWVVPVCELGTSDRQIHCRSHLGHLLHDGDCVWG